MFCKKRCSCRLRPGTSFKKTLWHRCFPLNFAKFLRTSFLIKHLRWLLLISKPKNNRSIFSQGLFETVVLTLSWRRKWVIRNCCINTSMTTPLICRANQWTGFYMITASVMKELNKYFRIFHEDFLITWRLLKTFETTSSLTMYKEIVNKEIE